MQNLQKIFITGGNRGLGHELVKIITQKHSGFELHLTCRGDVEGQAKESASLAPSNDIVWHRMDINDQAQVRKVAAELEAKGTKLDFIVANAAFCHHEFGQMPSYDLTLKTMQTNVDSTIDFVNQFRPLLSPTGRVIVVASEMAALKAQPETVQGRLGNPNLTEEEVLSFSK